MLISRGADVNAKANAEGAGLTPLHHAVSSGDGVRELLLGGADWNLLSADGQTAADRADRPGSAAGVAESVQMLRHVDEFAKHRPDLQPKEWLELFFYLRDRGMDMMDTNAGAAAVGPEGHTPLHMAAKEANEKVVRQFLRLHPEGNEQVDNRQRTPLHYAAEVGSDAVAKAILQVSRHVDAQDDAGDTPLHVAIMDDHPSDIYHPVVKVLLAYGANTSIANHDGEKPIDMAYRHPEAADFVGMLEYAWKNPSRADSKEWKGSASSHFMQDMEAPSIHTPISESKTPLHEAVIRPEADPAVVQELLERGADVNGRDAHGQTPLFGAAPLLTAGAVDKARFLLSAGADLSVVSRENITVLAAALLVDNKDFVEALLDFGADYTTSICSVADWGGCAAPSEWAREHREHMLPLFEAAATQADNWKGKPSQVLMEARGFRTPLMRDGEAMTALHHAVEQENEPAVVELIDRGADVNARDFGGGSVLHYAVENKNGYIVDLILKAGAMVRARNREGETPLDIARRRNEHVDLLLPLVSCTIQVEKIAFRDLDH